jgi:RNA recognition motif. (a.k.a. RRM, RBD, or RNP domain)
MATTLIDSTSTFPTSSRFYDDLAINFRKLWLDDPIFQAMELGTVRWGDLLPAEDIFTKPKGIVPLEEVVVQEPKVVSKLNNWTGATAPAFPIGRLTIITRNLPRDISVETLRTIFDKYGPIKDIYIPKNMDKSSPYFGTVKGFALIKFLKSEHSAMAYQTEYGHLTIGKNNITIEFAKEDR